MPPMSMNRGAVAVDKWLAAQGRGAASKAANTLNASPSMVSGWRAGDKKPNARYRIAIEEMAPEVSMKLWDEDIEVAGDQPAA